MSRSLAQHVSPVSSSFLSSLVEDNLAKADCMSIFFDEGWHRDYHRATSNFTFRLTVGSAEGQSTLNAPLSCCYRIASINVCCQSLPYMHRDDQDWWCNKAITHGTTSSLQLCLRQVCIGVVLLAWPEWCNGGRVASRGEGVRWTR